MKTVRDDKWFKKNSSIQSNTIRHSQYFHDRMSGLEASLITSNENDFRGLVTRQSTFKSPKLNELNHLFKIPNFDNIPVKKVTVRKSVLSPKMRAQKGIVKKDLKQQPKMSFLPHSSFINSRKTLLCSRTNEINSKKEVIKKMVFLSECALKENKEIKQSTPVKVLAGLTPRKTPKSKGYLVLPEFKKMGIKSDFGTPIQDVVTRGAIMCSAGRTPLCEKKQNVVDGYEDKRLNMSLENKERVDWGDAKLSNSTVFSEILRYCRIYNTEVSFIYGKFKMLEDCFENNVKQLPDCQVYDEFCLYQSQKEELYNELKILEETLQNSVRSSMSIGKTLKDYVKKRRELFDKQRLLHKNFEDVVDSAMEKCKLIERCDKENETEEKETPKLRRSLRLPNLANKNKFEENTPMSKKLKKLDSKSKGIQKVSRRIRSP